MVFRSIFDLVEIVFFFLLLISPGIILNYESIKAFIKESPSLFVSVTGFNVISLISNSTGVSLKLILCSIIISTFFGLLIALVDSFSYNFHWLPNLFILISAIPIFIIAFYIPFILSIAFLVCMHLLLLSKEKNKAQGYLFSLFAFAAFISITVAYCAKIGALDSVVNLPPSYLPGFINSNIKEIIAASTTITENFLPYLVPLSVVFAALFFFRKEPLQISLNIFVSTGFMLVYLVILYCYRASIGNTYLLAPVLSLSIGNLVIGQFIQQLRHGIKEEMQFEYIKAAMARGAPIWVHIKKKVFILTLDTVKSQFIVLISLTVIVEKIYNLDGLGFLIWEYATQQSDIITVSWIVLFSIFLIWGSNNIIKLLVFFVSPPK